MQWDQRQTTRNALQDPNVDPWHHRWATDGAYHALCAAAVLPLPHTDPLATSVLHGAGSHTVGNTGASASGLPVIRTSKATRH